MVEGRPHHKAVQFAFSKLRDDGSLDAFKVTELDAWKCRAEFFALRRGDSEALLKFLTKMGVWLEMKGGLEGHWSDEVTQHIREGHPVPIDVAGLWGFREGLKAALVNRKAFTKTYAPVLKPPQTGLQLLQQSGIEFPLSFELTDFASGVVTLTDAYHTLLATVFFDVASGLRFRVCQRADCGQLFSVRTRHEKKFCCWYCAHITTVRRNRPHKGKRRRSPVPPRDFSRALS
jgi:hypothetical protein